MCRQWSVRKPFVLRNLPMLRLRLASSYNCPEITFPTSVHKAWTKANFCKALHSLSQQCLPMHFQKHLWAENNKVQRFDGSFCLWLNLKPNTSSNCPNSRMEDLHRRTSSQVPSAPGSWPTTGSLRFTRSIYLQNSHASAKKVS